MRAATGFKNLTRAERKKAVKKFKAGDVVTWGNGATAHRVVEVDRRGCVIDVTSCAATEPHIDWWTTRSADGRYLLLVLFDRNMQGNGPRCQHRERGVCAGPVRHTDIEPDRPPKW